MGYTKIYIHLVWTTYKRQKLLTKDIREKVLPHIKQNAKTNDIFIDHIGGYLDHVHCLIAIDGNQNISQVVQYIKGESSYWINKRGLVQERFRWQSDYYAVSVGILQLKVVRNYIRNQEAHHQRKTLEKELSLFKKLYGLR